MQCANGKGNGDALALQLRTPNVGANGVVDFVNRGVIAHVEFDLVDDGVIGEIDEIFSAAAPGVRARHFLSRASTRL